jgi:MFS family permease
VSAAGAAPEPRAGAPATLAVSFVTLGLVYGIWYAYSVFLVALLRDFGWPRSILAGAFSVFVLVHGGLSPALGWLCDRVGPRRVVLAGAGTLAAGLAATGLIQAPWQLFLSFGVVTAVGIAAAGWIPAVVLVQRGVARRRLGLALGIVGSGIGAGIFLVVPLCQLLIDRVGWRGAVWTMGGLCLAWIVPATLVGIRDLPAVAAAGLPAGARDPTLADALRGGGFWLLALVQGLGSLATQTLLVHQAAYLVDHGQSALAAASVVSLVGLASIGGKTGGGWVSDFLGRRLVYLFGMSLVVASVGVLGLVALGLGLPAAYAYGVLIGVGYSVSAALWPAIVADRFPGRHFGSIFGAMQAANALGGSLGPWAAGRLHDAAGSYAVPFAGAALAAGLAAALLWVATRRRRR